MYRLVEDAWEAELFPWLRHQSSAVLSGAEAWVVVPTRAQAGWLRRRCLESGQALLGVKFLTPGSLRRELSMQLDLETRALGRESLEFLLRLQALKRSSPEARSVALSPTGCLQALDDLGRAGWTGEETDLGEIPSPVDEWLKILGRSGAWTPSIDAELRRRSLVNGTCSLPEKKRDPHVSARNSEIHLLIFGWDAAFFPESTLLEAAVESATTSLLLVPSPRGSSPDQDMVWVSYLEKLLGVEAEICPASEFRSVNEELVERLVRRGEGQGSLTLPLFLAGESTDDQVAMVQKQLLLWLKEGSCHERIALIVPAPGPLSLELCSQMLAAGLPFHDEAGRPEHPPLEMQLQGLLSGYYLSGGNVLLFLELVESWKRLNPLAPDPIELRSQLYRRFGRSQTQQTALLLRGVQEDHTPLLQSMAELVQQLGSWPQEECWEVLKARWQQAAALFGIGTEKLEPLWSRMDGLMTEPVNGRAFLQYVSAITESARHARDQRANQPFARVVLTTLDQAVNQSWAHVIFLESNEGIWPQRAIENAFLDDPLREALNHRREKNHSLLLTSMDSVRIGQRRFLDILENTAGQIALAAQSRNTSSPEKPYYPNEWFLQCLLLDEESKEPVLKRWEGLVRKESVFRIGGEKSIKNQLLTDSRAELYEELRHLEQIRSSRINPELSFDEYFYCYPNATTKPWPISRLEAAVNYPATFALEQLFGAVSAESQDFVRSENWIVGTLVHEWVRRRVEEERQGRNTDIEAELKEKYWPETARNSLWWRTVFDLARWASESCWKQVQPQLASVDLHSEFEIHGSIETPVGPLRVKGRMDLLARDRHEWENSLAEIIDFKTGKAQVPSPVKLAQGEGMQFGAYLTLAMSLGAREVTLRCLSPKQISQRLLTQEDAVSALEGLALAARLQQSLAFGMSGSLHGEHEGSEVLPMATLPVDAETLKQKAERSKN